MIKKITLSLLTGAFLLMLATISFADTTRKKPSLDGMETAGPYYNPATKSYFEMISLKTMPGSKKWDRANTEAMRKVYKGAQGRLAIVKDIKTHQFLLRNFDLKNAWIGLQYFCSSQTAKWVDGTDASNSYFSAWDAQWSNSHIRCANKGYMPVHYTTENATSTPRWRASGPNKGYTAYLVEYATGKE